MSTTSGPIGYGNPTAVIAPDLAVQQAQIQRQQDIIDALRQQSFQQIDGGRGAISWTQGFAKLADALAARSMQKRNDQRAVTLNQALAQRLFGPQPALPPADPGMSMPGSAPPPAAPAAAIPAPGSTADPALLSSFDAAIPPKGGGPVSPPAAAPVSGPGASMPAQAPPQPAPAPAGGGNYPFMLSGNRQQDMLDWALAPQAYGEAVVKAHAPVPVAQAMQQARAALDRGDVATANALLGNIEKENYIAPVNARGGSWTIDPHTGARTYNPNLPEGSEPVFDGRGNVVAVRTVDGVLQSVGAVQGAKTAATQAAEAPYELVTVTDGQGNTYQIPKSQVPGVGGAGAAGGGSLNAYYGRGGQGPAAQSAPAAPAGPGVQAGPGGIGVQTGRAPGVQSADTASGKNSANDFNAAIQGGAGTQDAIRSLNNIMTAAHGLSTGPGSGALSEAKSAFNAVAGVAGLPEGMRFDKDAIARFDEMSKNGAALASQLATAAAGPNGTTDARLANAIRAIPGQHYSPAAIQEVGFNLKAVQAAILGRSQAAARWQQGHGPNSYPAFSQAWQGAYNPDVFYYMQKGPAAFGAWVNSMAAADKARTMGQYRQLKALGAF